MSQSLLIICLVCLFSCALCVHESIVELVLEIKSPSGIVIDRVVDPSTQLNLRFGRLQHNAVSLRPHWSSINIVPNVFADKHAQNIIDRAEQYAAIHGWSKGRHVDYVIRPTQDLPLHLLFPLDHEWRGVQALFKHRVLIQFEAIYGINASLIRMDDVFVTRYHSDSNSENKLGPHVDKSPWSFVIGLNDDFEGGGTYFLNTQKVYRPPRGAAVIFNGKQQHGAYPISQGNRYILAGFCEYGSDSYEEFMAVYDPVYDGYAAEGGFRTGDLILGLDVCYALNTNTHNNNHNNHGSNDIDGGVHREEGDIVEECDGQVILRRLEEVRGEMGDEGWIDRVDTCETLCSSASRRFKIRRKVELEGEGSFDEL
ncbi:hypothetical protein EON65_25560 [archaeon]|nr:MAG: hypothetical protein EON65_25560 [archaeon]